MSALLSRECDRLLALLAQQEVERKQRYDELMAGFDKLDETLDDAARSLELQYAKAMLSIVKPADPNN
jgi:hypothetical protein